MLYSKSQWDSMEKELRFGGKTLVPVSTNLVDEIWKSDRPDRPLEKAVQLPIEFAGKSTSDKLQDVRKELTENGAEFLIVTELDEVACKWIQLN